MTHVLDSAHPAPPVTQFVRDQVRSLTALASLIKAYYEPQWRAPSTINPARERRAHGETEIIVGEDGETVLWLGKREMAMGPSELLVDSRRSLPKASGGGQGSRGPTTQPALVKALREAGCEVAKTGSGHLKATKNGKSVTLPSSASDWRSIRNVLAQARQQGLV